MHFLQVSLKANIFYPNRFLYVLPKTPRNKLLLATHDYNIFRIQCLLKILCLPPHFNTISSLLLLDGVKVALRNGGMTVEAARQCAKDRKE